MIELICLFIACIVVSLLCLLWACLYVSKRSDVHEEESTIDSDIDFDFWSK